MEMTAWKTHENYRNGHKAKKFKDTVRFENVLLEGYQPSDLQTSYFLFLTTQVLGEIERREREQELLSRYYFQIFGEFTTLIMDSSFVWKFYSSFVRSMKQFTD